MKTERNFRYLRNDEARRHFDTLNSCYHPWGDEGEWKRRYTKFPEFDFTKDVIVAEENGKWTGGGTAWFREASLSNDKKIRVYEAGDLYVLSDFRGKGVYSTTMRSLNKMAQERGAVLGFGFPSVYGVAASALPKYGFVDAFYPVTKIFLLKPEKFLDYFHSHLEDYVFPPKYDGLKLKIIVPLNEKRANRLSKMFRVEKGRLKELTNPREVADFVVKADFELLAQASSLLYRRKKTLYAHLILALLRGRLSFRLSLRFLKAFLGF